jgi:tape measure domain-containing protein
VTEATLNIKVNSTEVEKASKSLNQLSEASGNTDKSSQKLTKSTESLAGAARMAIGAFTALGASISIREIIQAADAWKSAENQLRLVTTSTADLANTQKILMGVSNETRSSFESTANLYSRLSRATSEMGLSQTELVGITETINKSFAVSGATAAEAAAAITQLSQGLAAGALRGDEFNSVAEQAPGIMQAIAKSLNMTTGELRTFAGEGGVTAEIVVKALQQASDSIAEDFGKSMMTFGQATQIAKNNALEFVGSSNAITSATDAAGRAVIFLSDNIDTLVMIAGGAATLMGARLASSIAAAGASAVTATVGMASLSSAMALLGGPVGIAVLASIGVYKLVDAYMDHNEAAREVETAAFLAQNGIHLAGEEFADVVAKIDAATQSLREYVESGGALSGMMEKSRQEAAERARAAIAARNATDAGTDSIVENTVRTKEQIDELRKSAVALDHGAFSYAKKTEAVHALIDSLSEVRLSYSENIALMNEETFVMQGVTTATKELTVATQDTGESAQEAARAATESWGRTHEYLTNAFIDISNDGGSAFEKIADSAVQSVKRIIAEWLAMKAMVMLGIPGGSITGGGSAVGSIASSAASSAIGSAAIGSGVGQFVAGATGTATGIAAGTMGPPTAAAAAGSGIGATIAGGAAAAGSAISGAGAAMVAFAVANPVIAAALAAAALAAALSKEETPSGNAGFLIRDLAGGGDGRTFDVEPFASGFDPVGFARREDQGAAVGVIDTFRQYDAALTAIANAAGIDVNYNSNTFGGFDEKGQGNGLFFGAANEDGDGTSVPIQEQLDQYVSQWIAGLGGQVDPSLIADVLAAGSADEMVKRAGVIAGVPQFASGGYHAGGLMLVGESGPELVSTGPARVLNNADTMTALKGNSDTILNQVLAELSQIRKYVATSVNIIDQWNGEGMPAVRT